MPERDNVHAFGPQDYYVDGNVMEGHYGADEPLEGVRGQRNEPIEDFLVDKPFFESYVTTQSADEAYENVLADVGCNVPMLDEHDQRVIEETRAGTTTYKGSICGLAGPARFAGRRRRLGRLSRRRTAPADWDTDHDGLPNAWETQHGLNPNSPAGDFTDANADPDGDGFTNLEDYLNSLAAKP